MFDYLNLPSWWLLSVWTSGSLLRLKPNLVEELRLDWLLATPMLNISWDGNTEWLTSSVFCQDGNKKWAFNIPLYKTCHVSSGVWRRENQVYTFYLECTKGETGSELHVYTFTYSHKTKQILLCPEWTLQKMTKGIISWRLLGSSAGKESACNAGDPSSIAGSGSSPGEGIG